MRDTKTYISLVKRKFGIRFVIDNNPDHQSTVFLAGTARSGTTWVSELINFNNEYRYIFEPFNYKKVPATEPFGGRKYLRPDEDNKELFEIMQTIVSGRIRSAWTERFNWRFIANQRLIKAVRANLLLKWLHTHFPGIPIVLVFRHPCAVANSYEKHGWRGAIEPLLAQDDLIEDFLSPYKMEIEKVEDKFERAIIIWCIETLVPLKQFKPGEIHIAFYENLVTNSEVEIKRLFTYLGKDAAMASSARMDRPSFTTRKDSAIRSGNDLIDSWRNKVSDSKLQRAMDIVKLFGLDQIYSEESMPNAQGAIDLMRKHS